MAAQYPTAIKTFVNPTGTNTTNSPAHATQHADANDEITAIQTELGLSPSDTYATVKARLDDLPNVLMNITGDQTVAGIKTLTGTLKMAKGANVASAGAVTLGDDGNTFTITGTTTITSIAIKSAGTIIILIFETALTLTDGSNLSLQGNFVTTAGDCIILVSDGTNWNEVARSQVTPDIVGLGDEVAITNNTNYEAATDGFLIGTLTASVNGTRADIIGYIGASNPATSIRAQACAWRIDSTFSGEGTRRASICIPVKKGQWFRGYIDSFAGSPTSAFYFISSGS